VCRLGSVRETPQFCSRAKTSLLPYHGAFLRLLNWHTQAKGQKMEERVIETRAFRKRFWRTPQCKADALPLSHTPMDDWLNINDYIFIMILVARRNSLLYAGTCLIYNGRIDLKGTIIFGYDPSIQYCSIISI
jgi:hypothetical protein